MSIDRKDFAIGKPGETKPPGQSFPDGISRRWWDLTDEVEIAQSVAASLAQLKDHGTPRLTQYVRSSRLYGNVSLIGYMGISSGKFAAAINLLPERVTFNLAQSCVDTVTSKMGKNKPKPLFLTNGGEHKLQRKAKKLTQFMEGVFYEQRAHIDGPMVFRDGAVLGDGLTHVFAKNGRVCYERVLPMELWVDELEGMYGHPRQMIRYKPVDRHVLAAAFPKAREVIMQAQRTESDDARAREVISDLIDVREAWRLPSGPDAKDGKHVISIDGHCIAEIEEWPHDFFPFARFSWCPRIYGYWSQGGIEQIQGTQIELNNLLWTVQRSMRLGGSYVWMIPIGSKVVKEHMNNEFGRLVYYSGSQAPQCAVPPMVQPEIYQQIQLLIQRGYDEFGVSQLSANSEKPPGLNAAVALREYNDIESDRFRTIGERYEDYFMQLAKLTIAVVKDISKEDGGYEVKIRAGANAGFLKSLDWKEIDLSEDDYVMQCFPVSSLPNDPAGRYQQIQEWVQAGWYSVEQGKRLMNFPDLEQVNSLSDAMEDRLEEILGAIVDDGEYTPPEPYYNLQRAQELGLQYLVRGESNNLEGTRLSQIRQWLAQVGTLQQAAQDAAQQQALAQQAAQVAASQPPNPPQPPAHSELAPNVGPRAAA